MVTTPPSFKKNSPKETRENLLFFCFLCSMQVEVIKIENTDGFLLGNSPEIKVTIDFRSNFAH